MNSGSMIHWRFKPELGRSLEWRFGWVAERMGSGLVKLGRYNGDTMNGVVVSEAEVEWKPYKS
jgi:hypothetical protein